GREWSITARTRAVDLADAEDPLLDFLDDAGVVELRIAQARGELEHIRKLEIHLTEQRFLLVDHAEPRLQVGEIAGRAQSSVRTHDKFSRILVSVQVERPDGPLYARCSVDGAEPDLLGEVVLVVG